MTTKRQTQSAKRWTSRFATRGFFAATALLCLGTLMCLGTKAQAAVTFTADPTLPTPEEADVYTHDPYAISNGGAGIAFTEAQGQRNLRQTFKLTDDINVGQIILSIVGGQQSAGLQLRIYEVDDVLSNWNPGTLVHQSIFETTVVDSANWLQIEYTDGNIFNLPARSTGSQGYGIELQENSGILGANVGELRYNTGSPDPYADGRYLDFTGGGTAVRDIGLIIVGTDQEPPEPGDVDGMNGADLVDLQIIADHFRQDVTARIEGDLTGDFFVDFDDFAQWKVNYPGSLSELNLDFLTAPVPEPSALAVTLIGALGGVLARRRVRGAT